VGCTAASTIYVVGAIPLCDAHLLEVYDEFASLEPQSDLSIAHGVVQPKDDRLSLVYYLRFGNVVKIGFTSNPVGRWKALRYRWQSEFEVLVAEPGGKDQEKLRHKQFVALRGQGELFLYEQPLVDHINTLIKETPTWWWDVVLPLCGYRFLPIQGVHVYGKNGKPIKYSNKKSILPGERVYKPNSRRH
jgi:hypothetical protein